MDFTSAPNDSKRSSSSGTASLVLIFFSALAVFILDLLTPLGIAGGVPYILVILLALPRFQPRAVVAMAIGCGLLTLLGFFLSPAQITGEAAVLVNRCLAFFAIAVTTVLGTLQQHKTKELAALSEILERAVSQQAIEIRQRERAEAEAQKLYDLAPDMMASVDVTTATVIRCNETLLDRLEYSKDEIVGQPVFRLYHKSSHEAARATFQKFIETGDLQNVELVLEKKDGSRIDASLSVAAIRDETGKIVASHSVLRDITAMKQAREELRQHRDDLERRVQERALELQDLHERLELILNSIAEGIVGIDPEGTITFANAAALEMTGWEARQLLNQPLQRILHMPREEILSDKDRGLRSFSLEGSQYQLLRSTFWRKNEEPFPGELYLRPLGKQGDVGFVLTFRDVTQQEQIERESQQRQAELEAIIQAVPDIYLWLDHSGIICHAYAQVRTFGTEAQLQGQRMADLFSLDAGNRLEEARLEAQSTAERQVLDFLHSGGIEETWHEAHFVPLPDLQVLMIIRDVTVLKQSERKLRFLNQELEERVSQRTDELEEHAQQLEVLNQELAERNKELDDFTWTASHDLKEPLRGITNFALFLLEDEGERLTEEGRSRLAIIRELCERMERLISDLLHYSRLSRSELVRQPTDLQEVVEDVLDTLRITLTEKQIDVRIPQLLPTIECEPVQVREVLHNLVVNAIKYTDKPNKWLEIGYYSQESDQSYVFYIRDNGIGIPQKYLSGIFGLFKRLHAREAYGGGTGIGLTLVQKIIERHQGTIRVESTVDEGTTFYFTLQPTAQQPTAPEDR